MAKFFVYLDRAAAWTLLLVIVIYIISGFGMTKGIIDADLAQSLHLGWLEAIGLAAFVIHTGYAISLALKRHKLWRPLTFSFLVFIYALFIIWLVYMAAFYPVGGSSAGSSKASVENAAAVTSTVFTLAELSKYNGENGMPAYAAVDGVVYDMSALFKNGQHHGCQAGADITEEFYGERRHNDKMLENYQIVGTLAATN